MLKIITAEQATNLINDEATIAAGTMGLAGWPEEIAISIENKFINTGHPCNITLIHSSGCGDWKNKGTHHLGHEGLIRRLICAHTGAAPNMARLIEQNKIECYLLPQGVICQLFRAIAGNKPGVHTKVGLGTYVDPRLDGAKCTTVTNESIVEVTNINGEEWLHYKKHNIDIALIRGTFADEKGNIAMDKEAYLLEALPLAMAAKNSGGIVIAQVENIVEKNSINSKNVRVPGALVDYVVIGRPENHFQTMGTYYNPALSSEIRIPLEHIPKMPLDERKIIARRASMELVPNTITNLGIGMPDGVSSVAAEEGVSDMMTLTTEAGLFGGIPASGLDFGAAYNSDATIEHHAMFDFYDGGGLDIAFLGLAQTDKDGNANVSKFGSRVMGCGGFINISQNAKKVVFCGTFTNGAEVKVENGKIFIIKEGKSKKFLKCVDHITFSGKYASKINQPVYYITERCVFTLENEDMTLIEIAPGIDLERDILAQMDFIPRISPEIKEMDNRLFQIDWNNLRNIIEAKKGVNK